MKPSPPCIAVDAMGGDFGPAVVVPGAVQAAKEHALRLVLVGDTQAIEAELASQDTSGLAIEVVGSSQVVGMGDKPSEVVRKKKDSSIAVACRRVKEGHADGVVSAGNTGASLACGIFILGRVDGVERPALAGIMPTEKRPVVMVDVGATVDARSGHLFQFGIMGAALARTVLGCDNPRVALMSIGEEEGKGNVQVKEAFEMLRSSSVNFAGNVEGRDMFKGEVDVIVCDGFVGNVCLKMAEGLANSMGRILKRELKSGLLSQLGTVLSQGAFKRFKRILDYAEYGGAPILGLRGSLFVCHGASNSKAIKNATIMAARYVENKANSHIAEGLSANKDLTRYRRGKAEAATGS